MTTVADICERERISRLDIIKLDVEGSEISALLGAEKLFRSLSVGTVQVEYNVTWLREGRRLKDLFEFVNDLRYVLLAASPFGFIYYPKYGEGLDDFRMRNMILSREDHAQLLHPIGPTGRARVEWGGDRSASLPQKLNEGARGNRKSRHTPTDLAMPTRDQRRK